MGWLYGVCALDQPASFSLAGSTSDTRIGLHWLRVPERIQYRLAVRGDAPRYLGPLTRVDDLPVRRTLRSTNADRLGGTARQTVNSWQPSLCGCGSTHLEYTAS